MYQTRFDEDGLRDYFLEPIPQIFEAALLLDKAVDAHLRGDTNRAQTLLRQADMPVIGEWLDSIWLGRNPEIQAVRKIEDLPPIISKDQRDKPRDAPPDMKKALVARDGHHCRFCSIPLIRPEIRKELNRLYPEAARWTSTKARDQHRGLQVLWLQYDHVLVHSRGGKTSMDNIVVTCAACNYGRDRFTWDGLERLIPEDKRFVQDSESPFNPNRSPA